MLAKLYLIAHGLNDLVLNSSAQLKNVGKRVYTSDMMEKYASAKVGEEKERIRQWLISEDFEGLAEKL